MDPWPLGYLKIHHNKLVLDKNRILSSFLHSGLEIEWTVFQGILDCKNKIIYKIKICNKLEGNLFLICWVLMFQSAFPRHHFQSR
jgi:hypothetical protein